MKRIYLYILAIMVLSACGQNQSGNNPETVLKTEDSVIQIPGIEKLDFSDTVQLTANENMHFDKELFRVKAGKKLVLIFKNTGKDPNMSMAHNVVILNKDIDIADFADSARKAKNEDYVPSSQSSSIIAHTKMVIAGKSDTVEFTISQPGVYDFICSYPGHWGTMQGKIVAE